MSSFESNTQSDMNSSSISLSEESESFSFEKLSEKEKTHKFCRCIFCFNVPLIYFKSKYVYLKCIVLMFIQKDLFIIICLGI